MTNELKQGGAGVVRKDANRRNSGTRSTKPMMFWQDKKKERPIRAIGQYVKKKRHPRNH
jgi:hypothetical protein